MKGDKGLLLKEELYQKLYAPDIEEVPGLKELLRQLRARNLKLAIATTAPEMNRSFGLRALGLTDAFDAILGDEHATHGKPHPDIYLKTAKRLNVDPAHCLVFEDTPVGVEAGKKAGMRVVGLLTTHSPQDLNEADLRVKDFTQLVLQRPLNLMTKDQKNQAQ